MIERFQNERGGCQKFKTEKTVCIHNIEHRLTVLVWADEYLRILDFKKMKKKDKELNHKSSKKISVNFSHFLAALLCTRSYLHHMRDCKPVNKAVIFALQGRIWTISKTPPAPIDLGTKWNSAISMKKRKIRGIKSWCAKNYFFKFRPLFLCKLEGFLRSGMNICKAVTLLLIGHR